MKNSEQKNLILWLIYAIVVAVVIGSVWNMEYAKADTIYSYGTDSSVSNDPGGSNYQLVDITSFFNGTDPVAISVKPYDSNVLSDCSKISLALWDGVRDVGTYGPFNGNKYYLSSAVAASSGVCTYQLGATLAPTTGLSRYILFDRSGNPSSYLKMYGGGNSNTTFQGVYYPGYGSWYYTGELGV